MSYEIKRNVHDLPNWLYSTVIYGMISIDMNDFCKLLKFYEFFSFISFFFLFLFYYSSLSSTDYKDLDNGRLQETVAALTRSS